MKKERSTILYYFIALIILTGAGLFIFKDNLANRFLNYNSPVETAIVSSSTAANLNLDILRDSRIKALKNYVNIFDYNNLEHSQDLIQEAQKNQVEIIITNPDASSTASTTSTSLSPVRVRVGNSNPFIVKKVAK